MLIDYTFLPLIINIFLSPVLWKTCDVTKKTASTVTLFDPEDGSRRFVRKFTIRLFCYATSINCYLYIHWLENMKSSYSLPKISQILIFTVLKTSKLHIHCPKNFRFSNSLPWKLQIFKFAALRIWKSHIHCPENFKSSNSLTWESKSFIFTALKTSNLQIHCHENLKVSYSLSWKLQIFKFTALRI